MTPCRYGAACYNQSHAHRLAFSHPCKYDAACRYEPTTICVDSVQRPGPQRGPAGRAPTPTTSDCFTTQAPPPPPPLFPPRQPRLEPRLEPHRQPRTHVPAIHARLSTRARQSTTAKSAALPSPRSNSSRSKTEGIDLNIAVSSHPKASNAAAAAANLDTTTQSRSVTNTGAVAQHGHAFDPAGKGMVFTVRCLLCFWCGHCCRCFRDSALKTHIGGLPCFCLFIYFCLLASGPHLTGNVCARQSRLSWCCMLRASIPCN